MKTLEMKIWMSLWFILLAPLGSQAQEYSYVWANQYPALAEPQIVCCYDFDGDMQLDDYNGNVMLSLQSFVTEDFQTIVDDRIISNDYVRVWRWDQLPASDGPVALSILSATVSNPGLSLADRRSGLTQVFIDPAATSQFTGTMTAGFIDLYAESAETLFYVPLLAAQINNRWPRGTVGVELNLTLNEARLRGLLRQDEAGCQGVCSDTLTGIDPAILGALDVSGLIHHADEMDALNAVAAQCTCAGIDPQLPLIDYVEDNQNLTFACNYTELDETLCDDTIPFCQAIESPCDFAVLLSSFYDQDTNGNGVADSKSVGGLLGIAGATVTGVEDLIYADDFEH